MKITVDRYSSDKRATLSKVSIDGKFECYGLEDEHRDIKVKGDTRIPAGTYNVGIRSTGGFHNRYKTKYADMHQGMLHVQNVPNFEYILIHVGNYEKDTAGCLLLGLSKVETENKKMVGSSGSAYKKFYPKTIEAAKAGNLSITYIDNDRKGASNGFQSVSAEDDIDSSIPKPKKEYKVKSGEGLSAIAKKLNTTVSALKKVNAGKLKKWGSVEGFNSGEIIKVP